MSLLLLIIMFILTFGVHANLYMFRLMSWHALLSGLALPWAGFAGGCFAALAARQPPANVAAIANETGVQNTGIAIVLLKLSFPQPDADISSVIPVVVSIFTPGPLMLGYSVHLVIRWMKNRQNRDDQTKGEGNPDEPDVEMTAPFLGKPPTTPQLA